MTLSEQLAALEKRIIELEQDNKRVPVLEQENKRLHDTVAYLTKKLFGKSSEKTSSISEGQMSLFDEIMIFNEAEEQANSNTKEPDLMTEVEKNCQKRYKGQRKDVLQNLEHVKKVYHLATNERSCDICTTELVAVGEEFVRSELEFIPAKIRVIDYYRETLECRTCRKGGKSHMESAITPAPVILHSLASPSTIAWVIHQKFVNAVPLYRQENEWKMLGITLSRSTLSNWLLVVARDWLLPIVERLHQEILKERYAHADETPLQVLQEVGRKNTTKSYMWVYSSGQYGDHPIRLFEYQPGRGGNYPKKFLKGFKGFLHSDAYSGYDKVDEVIHCYCWAHVRRKFVDILPSDMKSPEATLAAKGIAFCNKLFEMEKSLKTLTSADRKEQRLELEYPVLEAFWAWVDSSMQNVPPKSNISAALSYARNHKTELMNYLKDGNCSISNNLAENSIRPFTVGRNYAQSLFMCSQALEFIQQERVTLAA